MNLVNLYAWNTTHDHDVLLDYLFGNPPAPDLYFDLLRLLACTHVRDSWEYVVAEDCKEAVRLGEDYALSGHSRNREVIAVVYRKAREAVFEMRHSTHEDWLVTNDDLQEIACLAASWCAYHVFNRRVFNYVLMADSYRLASRKPGRLADLIRHLWGPGPGWQTKWLSCWNTRDVVHLASSMGHRPDPAHLLVLADALEEAGCTLSILLDHFREPEHPTGCWAVRNLHRWVCPTFGPSVTWGTFKP